MLLVIPLHGEGGGLQLPPFITCRVGLGRLWETRLQCSLAQQPLRWASGANAAAWKEVEPFFFMEACAQHDALLAVL